MKKTKEITLTEQEWLGIKSIAEEFGLSISEFLASLSSQKLLVIEPESEEDQLDLQEALLTLAEAKLRGEEPMCWEDFETELDNNEISN
jgi:D-hexose-6-phosphate mutarotase